MTTIAWAIVVATILILPEDRGLKLNHPPFVGILFGISGMALVICTICELK